MIRALRVAPDGSARCYVRVDARGWLVRWVWADACAVVDRCAGENGQEMASMLVWS